MKACPLSNKTDSLVYDKNALYTSEVFLDIVSTLQRYKRRIPSPSFQNIEEAQIKQNEIIPKLRHATKARVYYKNVNRDINSFSRRFKP
jgi:hypothetical protein